MPPLIPPDGSLDDVHPTSSSSNTLLLAASAVAGAPKVAAAHVPYLVKDINPNGPSLPMYLTEFNGKLYFNADDDVHGQELWVSDGTEEGTFMVIDLVPGEDGSVPQHLTVVNDTLFFWADNNDDGFDLYKTDGTAEGTVRLADVNPESEPLAHGACGFNYEAATANNMLFFIGVYPDTGWELWASDGTPEGTILLADIDPGPASSIPLSLRNISETLFFWADGDVWKSDGTPEGTRFVHDVSGLWFFELGGKAYFNGDDRGLGTDTGHELWVSDGTTEGTRILKDINPGPGWSNPGEMSSEFNGHIYFSAFEPTTGRELWRTDGTEEGTVLFADINPGAIGGGGSRFAQMGRWLFFRAFEDATGLELWRTDGTAEGTVLVKDIAPGPDSSDLRYLITVNGRLYFRADDGVRGEELWQSDGTEAGTFLVEDFNPGTGTGCSRELTRVGNLLFYVGGDGTSAAEVVALDTSDNLIPATSSWGSVALALLLITGATVTLRRRRPTQIPESNATGTSAGGSGGV